ncbi:MFS transporter [Kineococcus sp. SYSU DK004]|uniref:MFS transporter n=1 Tax=Kineococcus sp. SYSU DK004 TaxID=3383125 RepID=UPI003D7DDAA3
MVPNAPPGRSRGGAVLVAALAVDSLGNGLFLPLSLVFFLRTTDVELGPLGVLLTVANAVALPVPVWVGALVDRVGARPVVVAAQLAQAAGFLAYAHVTSAAGVLAAATVVAVGVRAFWSAVFTLVADHADGDPSGRSADAWFSLANGARTAGLAAGGLLTGVVVGDGRAGTYRAVALAAGAGFALAAALIAVFVRAPGTRAGRRAALAGGYRDLVRDRPFLALVVLNTVFALASLLLGLALPTVVQRHLLGPAWLTAAVLAGNAALVAALAAPVGARLPRHRRTRVVALAAALWTLWALVLAVLGPAATVPLAVALAAVTLLATAAELLHAPASTALASATAPPAARGRYLASFQYSFAVASLVAPAFFTTLFAVDAAAPWLALAVLTALAGAGTLRLERTLPSSAVDPRAGPGTGG